MGTTGTPAWMARWNGPFLKAESLGVMERVPSGEIATDLPWLRIASTRGFIASMALAEFSRSMKMVPANSRVLPIRGMFLISFLPTPAISRRNNLAKITTSTLLWWLKTKTAGRFSHRCSSLRTTRFRPINALLTSAKTEVAKFRASLLDPVRAQMGRPAAAEGISDMVAATDLRKSVSCGWPRLLNRLIGQPLSSAITDNFELGLSG